MYFIFFVKGKRVKGFPLVSRNFLFFNEKEGFELNRWGNFGLDRNVRYSHDDLVGSYEFRNYVIDNNVLYKKPYIEFTYTDDSVVVYYNTFEEVAHEYEKYKNIYGWARNKRRRR